MIENESIAEIFLRVSKKYSNNLALFVENRGYTYKKLRKKSLQIAYYLNLNFKKERTVGIYLERSFLQIASVIGCLISGKSFIILDEKIPDERKKYIIKKLKIKCLISKNNEFQFKFKNLKIVKINNLSEKKEIKLTSIDYYKEDIVYYIFTSGSTGEPKGVQISNKNLICFVKNCQKLFKIKSNDRFILIPFLSFDLSVFPLWVSLLSGASLFYTTGSDITYPVNFIKKHKISVYCSVPSQIDILVNYLKNFNFKNLSVKLSVFCGEPLRYSHVSSWKKIFTNSKIFNTYGPSETTCFNTYHEVKKPNKKFSSEIVCIGKPMPDNNFSLVKNEIIISGKQVSSGYIDKSLSKGKFILKNKNYSYKTGDYARKIGKNYYFIGRKDEQVKISGYRVELGDIEKNISKILNNIKVLVLYFNKKIFAVIERKKKITSSEIIKIKRVLASHVMPKKILNLQKFPLNKNMKIDKNKIKEIFKYEI